MLEREIGLGGVNEGESFDGLGFCGLAREDATKQSIHARRGLFGGDNFRQGNERAGLFHNEGRVEGEKRLLRNGGARTAFDALIGNGKVEGAE